MAHNEYFGFLYFKSYEHYNNNNYYNNELLYNGSIRNMLFTPFNIPINCKYFAPEY